MGLAKLNQLYREVILDHAQHPRNRGELADATGDGVAQPNLWGRDQRFRSD